MSIDYQVKYKNMANGRHEFQRWEKISEEKATGMVKRHLGSSANDALTSTRDYGHEIELPLCWIRARVQRSPLMTYNADGYIGSTFYKTPVADKAKGKDYTSIRVHAFDQFRKPTYEEIKADNMTFFEVFNKLRSSYINYMCGPRGKDKQRA